MEGRVRTPRESKIERGTHFLENGNGGTSQENKGERENEGHSLSIECRWRDKL
jgi:hypothetical protein